MSRSSGHPSGLPSVPKVRVNFASPEELRLIPGVGAKMADTIILLRQSHGNMDPELFVNLLRLDFSPNPALQVGEDDWGLFPEGAMGGGQDFMRLRIHQEIEKMEKALRPGAGHGWSAPSKVHLVG